MGRSYSRRLVSACSPSWPPDACKDAGESALASKAELAGKLMLLMLALPLFEKIAQLAASLINGEAIS